MRILLSSLLFMSSLNAQNLSEAELFEKAFKRKAVKNVMIPLFFEGQLLGEVQFKVLNGDQLVEVRQGQLRQELAPFLSKEILKSWEKQNGLKNIDLIKEDGVDLSFDPKNLLVKVEIDPNKRNLSTEDIAFNRVPKWARRAKLSTGLSGFLNTYNYYRKDTGSETESLTSDQNLNLNFGKLSFLAQTSWQRDNEESDFFRQDVRFTYDDPKRLIRYQLGDLSYNVNQFQSFQPGLGFLASSNFSLDPYRLFNPMTFREITLNTPSRVRVFVNGVLVQTLNLPTGRHRLDNLPLNEGINNIRLEIQDNRGRQEEISFKGTTSYNLISNGIHDFTYGGGVPAKNQFGDREYDSEDRKYFGIINHLYGFSNNLNLGYGANFNSRQRVGSFRFLTQSLLGFTNLNFSYSRLMKASDSIEGEGVGFRLGHTFRDYATGDTRQLRTFDIALEYLGPEFTPMEKLTIDHGGSLNTEIGVTQFVTDHFNYRVRGNYRSYSRDSNQNNLTGSVGLTYLWNRNYQITGQYSYSQFRSGNDDHQMLFSFTYTAPENGQSFSASYNTTREEFNSGVSYTGKGRPSNIRAQANYRNAASEDQYEAELGHQSQWYVASANWLKRNPETSQNSDLYTFNVNSSLVFAGGRASLSRPVNQSFTMVTAGEALEGHNLYLNKNGERYEASTGFFNSGVIPSHQAYRYYPVRIDSSELPLGVKSPPQEVVVSSPFRGGIRLDYSYEKTYAFVGKIKWKGAALALKTGELVLKDDPKRSYAFFTNRKGRFLIESILPGKYLLVVDGKPLDDLVIEKAQNGFIKWEKNYE